MILKQNASIARSITKSLYFKGFTMEEKKGILKITERTETYTIEDIYEEKLSFFFEEKKLHEVTSRIGYQPKRHYQYYYTGQFSLKQFKENKFKLF